MDLFVLKTAVGLLLGRLAIVVSRAADIHRCVLPVLASFLCFGFFVAIGRGLLWSIVLLSVGTRLSLLCATEKPLRPISAWVTSMALSTGVVIQASTVVSSMDLGGNAQPPAIELCATKFKPFWHGRTRERHRKLKEVSSHPTAFVNRIEAREPDGDFSQNERTPSTGLVVAMGNQSTLCVDGSQRGDAFHLRWTKAYTHSASYSFFSRVAIVSGVVEHQCYAVTREAIRIGDSISRHFPVMLSNATSALGAAYHCASSLSVELCSANLSDLAPWALSFHHLATASIRLVFSIPVAPTARKSCALLLVTIDSIGALASTALNASMYIAYVEFDVTLRWAWCHVVLFTRTTSSAMHGMLWLVPWVQYLSNATQRLLRWMGSVASMALPVVVSVGGVVAAIGKFSLNAMSQLFAWEIAVLTGVCHRIFVVLLPWGGLFRILRWFALLYSETTFVTHFYVALLHSTVPFWTKALERDTRVSVPAFNNYGSSLLSPLYAQWKAMRRGVSVFQYSLRCLTLLLIGIGLSVIPFAQTLRQIFTLLIFPYVTALSLGELQGTNMIMLMARHIVLCLLFFHIAGGVISFLIRELILLIVAGAVLFIVVRRGEKGHKAQHSV